MNSAKDIEAPEIRYETSSPEAIHAPPEPEPDETPEEVTTEETPEAASKSGQSFQSSKPPKTSRVFDGLADDEKPLFQQMSNAAYARIYPEWIKRQEAAEKISKLEKDLEVANAKRYYEEDGAWELDPDVKSTKENLSGLDTEQAFWKEQYAAVEAGEKWYELVLDKNGRLAYGKEQEPSAAAKAEILSKLTEVSTLRGQLKNRLDGLSSTFKQRHQSVSEGLKKVDQEIFGSLDMTKPHIKTAYENHLKAFPRELQSNTMAQMLAKSRVVIEGLVSLLRSKEVSSNGKTAVRKVVTSQGPGPSGGTGSSSGNDADRLARGFASMTRDF